MLIAGQVIVLVGLLGEVWVLVVLNLYATATVDAGRGTRLVDVPADGGGGVRWRDPAEHAGAGQRGWCSRSPATGDWCGTTGLHQAAAARVILCGMILFQPAPTAAAVADGSVSGAQQWRQVAVVATQLVLLGTVTVLAVFKPRRRIGRWPRP